MPWDLQELRAIAGEKDPHTMQGLHENSPHFQDTAGLILI